MADALTDILRAAGKHPNSRVSKLIHTVEEEPSQKNIVLLLIELAEHAEYSVDFNISLKYYLDLFERLGFNHDLVLNEAGLLLVNSSKIYSKRIDYVQSLVERQILTLSNADTEIQQQKLDQQQESQKDSPNTPEKPKRGRKRALEVPSDPYEVELAPKKFKKLTEEKRFTVTKQTTKPKLMQRNIEVEQHIHPAGWLHAAIYDFENEEDVDTKRNYKLFTYHVEHRYNTLVPDINFRLHFKVKDYMDEQEEMDDDEACNTEDRSWPPLSEAYVQKYLRLENYVLQQGAKTNKRKYVEPDEVTTQESNKEARLSDNTTDALGNTLRQLSTSNINDSLSGNNNDTGLGQSLLNDSNKTLEASHMESSQLDNTQPLEISSNSVNLSETTLPEVEKSLNVTAKQSENDSALGSSLLDHSNSTEINTTCGTNGSEDANKETSANFNDTATDGQEANDSGLSSSVLNETKNTETNDSLVGQEKDNNSTTQTELNPEESSEMSSNVLDETKATEANETLNTQDDNNEDISHTINITTENQKDEERSSVGEANVTLNVAVEEEIEKTGDESKVENDDRKNSISIENMTKSMEKNSNQIDLNALTDEQQTTKDSTQLQIQLPTNEDEGVCLSDLEEQDFRLLSPTIRTVNIFPGVVRKDITILMDDELRKALDMRDGIMDHFGTETYKVPIIAEAMKHDLVFNILKLPEKQLRRKVLFKLGPEMDLFLQARCLKRGKAEPVTRVSRKFTPLQWFSLNNTDMTGVFMTPPNSPGHCSDFCGFTDDEGDNDDTMSCSEFCGFTEEEQDLLGGKNSNRLSRDSGVGVDVNNLTPDKEPLEIIFERNEATEADIENCKRNINFDQEPKETTESLLKQLPAEIRDALTIELNESQVETSHTSTEGEENLCTEKSTESMGDTCDENSEENTKLQDTENTNQNATQQTETNSVNNTEDTDVMCTENRTTNTESQDTQATENLSSDNQTEGSLGQTTGNTEAMEASKSIENSENTNDKQDSNAKSSCDKTIDNEDSNHFADCENCDSEDDIMLDLDTQGTKSKIQQWHEHLQPILAKSRERHHFDVFQLGTEIIETVQSRRNSKDQLPSNESSSSDKPSATFHNIMEDKDHSYVSRYFLSTLLLANQSNIEISINNKSSEKPTSWEDLNLKLLSTKRHTVAIEDNIGMIDNKTKSSDSKAKSKTTSIKTPSQKLNKEDMEYTEDANDEDDEPLVKLQNIRKSIKKSSLKRVNDNATSTPYVNKKSSLARIHSVEIIPAPLTPLNIMPGTSQQAKSHDFFHVNLNEVRTLQPIEKVQKRNDDLDSGIFSTDDISTS